MRHTMFDRDTAMDCAMAAANPLQIPCKSLANPTSFLLSPLPLLLKARYSAWGLWIRRVSIESHHGLCLTRGVLLSGEGPM